MSPELKVGFFFFLAVGLAVTFTVAVRPNSRKDGDLAVVFPKVARLKPGDPVHYNGVRVGQVSDVVPVMLADGTASVRVTFAVEARFLPTLLVGSDTVYRVGQGTLGGAWLDIISRGGVPATQELLAQVRGQEPVGLDDAIASVQGLIEENRAEVRKAIASMGKGLDAFGEMSVQIRDAVQENREGIKAAVTNVGGAAGGIKDVVGDNRDNLKEAVASLKALTANLARMAEENRDQLKATIRQVGDAAGQIKEAVEENRQGLRATTDGFAKVAPRLDRIGENLELITGQIAQGKGTLGKLVMDDALARKAEGVMDSASQRLEEVKPFTSGFSELKFYAGLDYGWNLTHGDATADAYVRLEPRPWKFYLAGVSYRWPERDADPVDDDPDKLNVDFHLLLGWRFLRDDEHQRYRLTVAGGLIDSRFGGLVSMPFSDRVSLTIMARAKHNTREPDDRRYEDGHVLLRASTDWRLWGGIYATIGCDDLLERPGLWAGLRGELLDNDLRNLVSVVGLKP